MARRRLKAREQKRRTLLPAGALLALLLGAVIIPAVLSLSVGIVALALWRRAFDIAFGVLVLCFATMAVIGAIVAIAFIRRTARLAELQSDFVATVTHELRTPLAGIRLLIETLAMGRATAPSEREEVLSRLASEQRRLEQLVEHILLWRRLTKGTAVASETCVVSELVTEAIAPLVAGREDAVQVRLDEAAPTVHGDREALVGALRNLVDNGLKFGAAGGPVTIVSRQTESAVEISVIDQGPGIPATEQARIFEPFYRVPSREQARGTGLGLAIARRAVMSCGGELWVESEGGGARFTISLPVEDGRPHAG